MKTSAFKLLILFFIIGLVVIGVRAKATGSFFTDTETQTGNTISTAESFPNPYVDEVVGVTGAFGHCCSDLSSEPLVAKPLVTGAPDSPPDYDFIQISDNSSITLKFVDNKAVPTGDPDPDIRVHIYDTLFPAAAEILVSQDCTNYTSLGIYPDTADADLNIEGTGYSFVKCVRIVDQVAVGDPYPTLGFDLDAVEALSSAAE